MDQQINKIPITIITGFLGSGKTTLLQKIVCFWGLSWKGVR